MSTHDNSTISAWFDGRLPDVWTTTAAPVITTDRDEITIVVTVPAPSLDADATDADRAEAQAGRISGFREDTRDRRIRIARHCLGCTAGQGSS